MTSGSHEYDDVRYIMDIISHFWIDIYKTISALYT